VREQAARAFAAWGDTGELLQLANDADFCVRKTALYHLGQLSPTPGIAGLAWDHLQRSDVLGVHLTETLGTFVKYAEPADAVLRLSWIAGDHGRREDLRVAAVHDLWRLDAAEEVRQLAGLLREPPEITWALHIALLEAIAEMRIQPPDIRWLRGIDNLDVRAAVARIET